MGGQALQPQAQHIGGALSAGQGAVTGKTNFHIGQHPGLFDKARHFEQRGHAFAARAMHANALRPSDFKLDVREVNDQIGGDVVGRVVHFVQQLQGAGEHIHNPRRTRHHADIGAAIGIHMGQGVTQPGVLLGAQGRSFVRTTYRLKVATGELPATFEQVAHGQSTGQGVALVLQPQARWGGKQSRVGHTPGDHHLRVLLQRSGDLIAAQIRMGTDQLPLPRLGPLDVFLQAHHIVADQTGHTLLGQSQLTAQTSNGMGGGTRIGRAQVGHHPTALLGGQGQQGAQAAAPTRIKPSLRVIGAQFDGGHQGALGQAFQSDGVDQSRAHQVQRRVDAVTRKARTRTNAANGLGRSHHGS